MPKHDADIRGRLAIVYNGETVTSKTNASNPQVGDPCHTLGATGAGRAVVIENHPQDSRAKINEDGVVQTLSGQMGTGGGNVPLILENK